MKKTLDISLPQGVRDILPEESETITRVEAAVTGVFAKYGFKRVITPLLEFVDVLTLGMGQGLKESVMKFIDPSTGRVVALRPDITPQIARMAATRMRDYPLPLKLFYNENVVRRIDPRSGLSREILQVGAEYISAAPSPGIDAEMIVMAIEGMLGAGLKDFKIDIGDVGFVKSVLDGLGVGETDKKRLREAVAIKDTSGLEAVVKSLGGKIAGDSRALLAELPGFYGEADVLDKAMALCPDQATKGALSNLKEILGIVDSKGFMEYVTVDLAEVRGFDYYTGIIFEGFASGFGKTILSGGRYDTLLKKYGSERSSTGFAFDVDNIVSVLERGGRERS